MNSITLSTGVHRSVVKLTSNLEEVRGPAASNLTVSIVASLAKGVLTSAPLLGELRVQQALHDEKWEQWQDSHMDFFFCLQCDAVMFYEVHNFHSVKSLFTQELTDGLYVVDNGGPFVTLDGLTVEPVLTDLGVFQFIIVLSDQVIELIAYQCPYLTNPKYDALSPVIRPLSEDDFSLAKPSRVNTYDFAVLRWYRFSIRNSPAEEYNNGALMAFYRFVTSKVSRQRILVFPYEKILFRALVRIRNFSVRYRRGFDNSLGTWFEESGYVIFNIEEFLDSDSFKLSSASETYKLYFSDVVHFKIGVISYGADLRQLMAVVTPGIYELHGGKFEELESVQDDSGHPMSATPLVHYVVITGYGNQRQVFGVLAKTPPRLVSDDYFDL